MEPLGGASRLWFYAADLLVGLRGVAIQGGRLLQTCAGLL